MKLHTTVKRLALISLLIAIIISLANCGGSSNSNSSPQLEATLTSLWDNEFITCSLNCHSPDAADGTELGPDLTTKDNFYNNLVNKSVDNEFPAWAAVKNGDCNATNFITPSDANQSTVAASLILSFSDALIATGACIITSYNIHDVNQVTLPDTETENALIEWINNGALNN